MRSACSIAAALVLAAAAAQRVEAQDAAALARLRALRESLVTNEPALIGEMAARAKVVASSRASGKPAVSTDRRAPAVIGWGRSGSLLVGLDRQGDAEVVAALVDSALHATGFDGLLPARLAIIEGDRLRGHPLTADDQRRLDGYAIETIALPGGRSNAGVTDARWRSWAASIALGRLAERYTPETLRRWTGALPLQWDAAISNPTLIRELSGASSIAPSSLAPRCLGGDGPACASYLGIDATSDPVHSRFPATDARRLAAGWVGGRDPLRARQCDGGSERACYEILSRYAPPSASSEYARASLLMFVLARHGPSAFRAVLADTASELGVRLARATGVEPTVLALAWRDWVLETSRIVPVHAGLREVGSAVLSLALLIGLATRGGRWFA